MNNIDVLKRIDLFSNLKRKSLKTIASACVERAYQKGEVLVQQGEPGKGLFMILSGMVRVLLESNGPKTHELAVLGPGEFFGEMTVLDNAPRSATVMAMDETKCLVLTAWVFKASMEMNPEIALGILPVLTKRFRELTQRTLELSRL